MSDFDLQGMYGDGLNLYAYLGSNPHGRFDPLGLAWDPFSMVDDMLGESLGSRLATLSAIGQGSKAAAVVMATIASYLPFPAAGVMGEAALRALGETSDSDFAMAMALSAVPGGKLAAVLGKATGAMWKGAMHMAKGTGASVGRWLGKRADGLMGKAKKASRVKCGCFVAATLVWTSSGLVPIEQVQLGDLVLAKDEETGDLILRPVTNQIVTTNAALLVLSIRQGDHDFEIRTTDEHPFWVQGRGWARADSLAPGEAIETLGGPALVRSLSFTGERTTVYNLSVSGEPNYFVGAAGVWVHNVRCGPKEFARKHGLDEREVLNAVERLKKGFRGTNPKVRNPDIQIDVETGDVYMMDELIKTSGTG
jgi:hypothetical protein